MKIKSRNTQNTKEGILPTIAVIISMFICSGILLFILSLVTYYLNLSSGIARICIYVIYAISTFVGGFVIGRIHHSKILLWGILMGAAYFAILFLTSLIKNSGDINSPSHIPLILTLCIIPALAGTFIAAMHP